MGNEQNNNIMGLMKSAIGKNRPQRQMQQLLSSDLDNTAFWKRIENLPDPIRIGNTLATVKLKISKEECRLAFYSHITGEETPTLDKPTHWLLLHPTLKDFELHVKEVYDDMLSNYYIITYQLYWGNLSPLAKYYISSDEEDTFFKRSYVKYCYN